MTNLSSVPERRGIAPTPLWTPPPGQEYGRPMSYPDPAMVTKQLEMALNPRSSVQEDDPYAAAEADPYGRASDPFAEEQALSTAALVQPRQAPAGSITQPAAPRTPPPAPMAPKTAPTPSPGSSLSRVQQQAIAQPAPPRTPPPAPAPPKTAPTTPPVIVFSKKENALIDTYRDIAGDQKLDRLERKKNEKIKKLEIKSGEIAKLETKLDKINSELDDLKVSARSGAGLWLTRKISSKKSELKNITKKLEQAIGEKAKITEKIEAKNEKIKTSIGQHLGKIGLSMKDGRTTTQVLKQANDVYKARSAVSAKKFEGKQGSQEYRDARQHLATIFHRPLRDIK